MAISNLTYKDYLWLTKEKDGVKGIRLSKDNLPSTLNPIASKTFEHVWSTAKTTEEAKAFTGSGTTGGSTNSLDYYIYFGKIKPTGSSYFDSWHVKLRLITECETNTNYRSEHIFNLYGAGSTVSYAMFNNIYSGSYINRLTSTGFNNGFSHLFGIDFYGTNTQNINNSNYKRKFYIEVLEQEGCEVSFFNDWISARNYTPATTSTNYYGYINTSNAVVGMGGEFNAVTNGLQETGDADNYFQIFSYFRPIAGGIGIKGISLISQLEDGTWASFTTNNTQATDSTKTNSPNTTDFFLIGAPIWYYSNNTILAAGSIAAGDYVYSATHAIDTRYISNYYSATKDNANSFAYNGSGYKQSNAYIKVDLFSGGRYKIRSLILNERDLRSSGKGYYIYIGRTYSNSTYQINLEAQNPIFYWNGSQFIEYSNYKEIQIRNNISTIKGNYVTTNTNQTISGKKNFTSIPTVHEINVSLEGHTHKASEVSGAVTTRDIFCIDLLKDKLANEILLEGGQINLGTDVLTMIYGFLDEKGAIGIALSLNNGISEIWFALVNNITDEVAYQSYSAIYDDTGTGWFENLNELSNYHIEVFAVTYEEMYNIFGNIGYDFNDITTARNNFDYFCTINLTEDKTAWIVEQ